MTMRQQWSLVAAIVLLLGAALFAATRLLGDELFPVEVGSDAPALKAVTIDGARRTRTMADYEGKVVLLNVWATWCEPCRVEMPSIEKLHREFGPLGLSVIAVSVDDAGAVDRIRDFVKEYGLTFEILHDPAAAIAASWHIAGYPETFIIGREGTIRKKVIGAADWSSEGNRALIRQLLGATPAATPAR